MNKTILEQLVSLVFVKPDQSAREKAAKHLLDWLACSAYGRSLLRGQEFEAWLKSCPRGELWNWSGYYTSIDHSIAFNASLGNIAEMDDVHKVALLHPGPVIIPVVLGIAEASAADMERVLDAIVIGYEVAIRLGRAVGYEHYRFWHNTSSCGGIAATAAAAFLLKLNHQQTVSAVANVASCSGGLWQLKHEPDCATKQFHCAEAARRAWTAVQMAASGITGVRSILEGPHGFFAALCPDAEPKHLVQQEKDWLIHECSFKPWPACRHTHPSIDAALALREKVDLKNIAKIELRTFKAALDFCDKPSPRSSTEAKFSLQHAIATALYFGQPELEHFEKDMLNDAEIIKIRDKVMVVADESASKQFPNHFSAQLTVHSSKGETIRHQICDALGDPENPLSLQQLQTKYHALMRAANFDEGCVDQLMHVVLATPRKKISTETLLHQLRLMTDGS